MDRQDRRDGRLTPENAVVYRAVTVILANLFLLLLVACGPSDTEKWQAAASRLGPALGALAEADGELSSVATTMLRSAEEPMENMLRFRHYCFRSIDQVEALGNVGFEGDSEGVPSQASQLVSVARERAMAMRSDCRLSPRGRLEDHMACTETCVRSWRMLWLASQIASRTAAAHGVTLARLGPDEMGPTP